MANSHPQSPPTAPFLLHSHPSSLPKALHLLSAMWDGGPTLAPDSVSYNTALKACANAFQVTALQALCDRCGPQHSTLDSQ